MSSGKSVRIAVLFEPGKKAQPVWFELNNRQHRIKQSTYHWQDMIDCGRSRRMVRWRALMCTTPPA